MTINSKYPGRCTRCGQQFPAGTKVEWTRGGGARHHGSCPAFQPSLPTVIPTLDLKPIVEFLQGAKDRGLKRPKLRVLAPDGTSELRISLTTIGQAPGSICIVIAENFIGCVRPSGEVTGALRANTAVQEHLLTVARDPANAARAYAALMCKCSFCGLPLTDEGSVEVGYGPICADHWGLPHVPKGTPALRPVPKEV